MGRNQDEETAREIAANAPAVEEAGDLGRSDGLGAEGCLDHLQFVEVVEVFGREDGVYVFGSLSDAERFEDAVAASRDPLGDESATFRRETPINVGDAAERLIAAERADVLDNLELEGIAGDLRNGKKPAHLAECLKHWPFGEGTADELAAESKAVSLLREWAALDEQGA